jgi:hypothetical protein
MDVSLFVIGAFVALIAVFGAIASLYGEESRPGFSGYRT